jgi:selenocysteine lyase/cysteine desulfurase
VQPSFHRDAIAARRTSIEEAQALYQPAAPYLNTASYGLPPRPAWEALQAALTDWRGGRTTWEPWGEATARAHALWAELVNVPVECVATGATVAELVGVVASAAKGAGARSGRNHVLAPEIEFTSLLWPFLAQGHEVVTVPLRRLAESVDAQTAVVAVSAVQSSTGEVADLEAVAGAARSHGALVVVDATQAIGWLPLDSSRFDAVVGAGYKWLSAPRGTAWLALSDRLLERAEALHAGWWAADDPHASYYGPPLRLSSTARRLATSPAWFSWVGCEPALEVIAGVGIDALREHDVALANRFRAGLGLPPSDSAIVSADVAGAQERLERAGIRASTRAGALRASFHLYNTEADVDAALAALVG